MKRFVAFCLISSILCFPIHTYAENKEAEIANQTYDQMIESQLKQGNTIVKFKETERSNLESNREIQSLLSTMTFPSTFAKSLIYINYPEEEKFGYNFFTTLNKDQIKQSYSYLEEILSMIPSDFTELEKIEFVYRYVSLLPYVDSSKERETSDQYAYSLFNGGAVCAAKADLVNALLKKLEIPTKMVIIGDKERRHALNLVFYEGKWYYLDCTYAGVGGIFSLIQSNHEDILENETEIKSTSEQPGVTGTPLEMSFGGYQYFLFGEDEFSEFYQEMKVENRGVATPKAQEHQLSNVEESLHVRSNPKSYWSSVTYSDLNFRPSELNILK